jgi:hypothetical protein
MVNYRTQQRKSSISYTTLRLVVVLLGLPQLRANSKLKSSEYSVPVLGLIFLRYADFRFSQTETES